MVLAPPFKYFWNFHPEPADFLDGLVQPPTSFFFFGGGRGLETERVGNSW